MARARRTDGDDFLGWALCMAGIAMGLAAALAPLPAGIAAVGLSLLGARYSRRRWLGRMAIGVAVLGSVAGLATAFLITTAP